MKNTICTAALLAGLATGASAAQISTLAGENSAIASWGLPNTAAYGQTFTLGSAGSLDNVTFRIDDSGSAVTYDLQVFAWGGTMATGTSLGSVSGATSGVSGMSTVSIGTGGIDLGAGTFVAFLQATSNGGTRWGSVNGSDAYAGGEFVFQNNGGNTSQWTTSNWSGDWQGPDYDLAFALDVSPIPLPAGLPLLVGALGALGLVRRKTKAA